MPRAIPSIQTTAMSFISGCLSASAGVPMIIASMHDSGMSLQLIFFIFTVSYVAVGVLKLICWTPVRIPRKVEDDYSLWENTYVRQCMKKTDANQADAKHEKPSSLFLFKEINFYMICFVYGAQIMRLVSHMTWIGSGWPEWVSDEDFDKEINEIQSICSFSMVAFNLVPGIIVDFSRRISADDYKGNSNGLVIVFSLSTILLIIMRYVNEP